MPLPAFSRFSISGPLLHPAIRSLHPVQESVRRLLPRPLFAASRRFSPARYRPFAKILELHGSIRFSPTEIFLRPSTLQMTATTLRLLPLIPSVPTSSVYANRWSASKKHIFFLLRSSIPRAWAFREQRTFLRVSLRPVLPRPRSPVSFSESRLALRSSAEALHRIRKLPLASLAATTAAT